MSIIPPPMDHQPDAARRPKIDALHIFGLWSLALAQPVYQLIAANPQFLAAHGAGRWEVLELVAAISLLLPAAIAGVVALVPVGIALVLRPEVGSASPAAGIWGSFVAHYWVKWLGGIGAWLVWILATSALMAATLAWNPIRALVGRGAAPGTAAPKAEPPAKKRESKDPREPREPRAVEAAVGLVNEPAPEEMPGISAAVSATEAGDEPKKPRKRKTRGDAEKPGAMSAVAAAGAFEGGSLEDELPSPELLNEVPRPFTLAAGRAEFERIVTNLIRNAAQAGAKTVTVRAVRAPLPHEAGEGAAPAHKGAAIDVIDDGPGLPADARARLFEPFAASRKGGTGLGLAIVRDLVEAHGGTVRLVDCNAGAHFRIELPRG